MASPSGETRRPIVPCPHCANHAEHRVLYRHDFKDTFYDTEGKFAGNLEASIYFVQCKSCEESSLLYKCEADENPTSLKDAFFLYPAAKTVASDIPSQIRADYDEARKIRKLSPPAFSVLIGRLLEAVCQDKQAKGKTLQAQIADLGNRNLIPPTIVEIANNLRTIRNYGAHYSETKIYIEDTELLDELLGTILEYIYVAPSKLKSIQKLVAKKGKKKTT